MFGAAVVAGLKVSTSSIDRTVTVPPEPVTGLPPDDPDGPDEPEQDAVRADRATAAEIAITRRAGQARRSRQGRAGYLIVHASSFCRGLRRSLPADCASGSSCQLTAVLVSSTP